jgi:hypothetical protein
LFAFLAREWLRTERLRPELRSRPAVGRPRSTEAASTTATSATTATPAPPGVLIAELRRPAGRVARTGRRAWVGVVRGFVRGLAAALARRLVFGAL